MTRKSDETTSRRNFLKLAGTTAPIAAVVTLASGTETEAKEADLSSDRIQDTAHTRAYYHSARF
ncbi:twin-arginine translocation signal domain-containing protein [Paracoccus saliphilus]|uniref:Formate dehydrogenase region TAT target n=1 Tax=Paracoccus saliphilus TaxID=405559 RepID=A0AA46A3V8_9RHOB|nr:twin-arginine translocation signal domain-containing protein [Paracoccus saliphilus]WCR03304.1 twin-arginine translocation signal domain-containing protein [Paracoccus saliphilus]SIS51087.1 formate dehydrogenase region TAT target [Paracoccus saliphilus]